MMTYLKQSFVVMLLGLCSLMVASDVRAQDSEEQEAETRSSMVADLQQTDHKVSCGAQRFLGLCGTHTAKQARASLYKTQHQKTHYNAFQRLAGAIADKMEAGKVGNMKIKFKIILE